MTQVMQVAGMTIEIHESGSICCVSEKAVKNDMGIYFREVVNFTYCIHQYCASNSSNQLPQCVS